jgi:hypothetical protein
VISPIMDQIGIPSSNVGLHHRRGRLLRYAGCRLRTQSGGRSSLRSGLSWFWIGRLRSQCGPFIGDSLLVPNNAQCLAQPRHFEELLEHCQEDKTGEWQFPPPRREQMRIEPWKQNRRFGSRHNFPNTRLFLRSKRVDWVEGLIIAVHRPGQISQFLLRRFDDLLDQFISSPRERLRQQPLTLDIRSRIEGDEMFDRHLPLLPGLIRTHHQLSDPLDINRTANPRIEFAI